MFVRTASLAALTLAIHSLSFGATIADFAKVYDGAGVAVDLNNAGQILLQDGSAGFSLFDLASGATSSVGLPAQLRHAGFNTLTVTDLSNTGYVTGMLNGGEAFVWSQQAGFTVVSGEYGGKFVNDAGVTVGQYGTWSAQDDKKALVIPGTVTAFNNAGQIGYMSSAVPDPDSGGWRVNAGVLSANGQSLLSVGNVSSFALAGEMGSFPCGVLLNDVGGIALTFSNGLRDAKFWNDARLPIDNLLVQRPISLFAGVASLNNAGQMVGSGAPRGTNLYLTATEKIDLGTVVETAVFLTRINDQGLILQSNPNAATFKLYQGPQAIPEPSTAWLTGVGALGLGAVVSRRRQRQQAA